MSRLLCLFIAVALALGSAAASAEPAKKRATARWHGYGFLPGYQQPLNNSAPLYKQKDALRRLARQNRRPWYIDPVPGYYDWNGDPRYFGRPGFLRRPLQWRQFWPVLDADADRAGVELRIVR